MSPVLEAVDSPTEQAPRAKAKTNAKTHAKTHAKTDPRTARTGGYSSAGDRRPGRHPMMNPRETSGDAGIRRPRPAGQGRHRLLYAAGQVGAGSLQNRRSPKRGQCLLEANTGDRDLQGCDGSQRGDSSPVRGEKRSQRRHRAGVPDDERRNEEGDPPHALQRQPQIEGKLQARQLDLCREQIRQPLRGVGRHLEHGGRWRRRRREGTRAQVRASPLGVALAGDSVSSGRRLRKRSPRSARSASPDFGASSSAAPAPTSRPTPKMLRVPSRRSEVLGLLASPSAERTSSLLRSRRSLIFMFSRFHLEWSVSGSWGASTKNTATEGESDQGGARLEAQLFHHPGTIGLDRLDAQPQLFGDLSVC